METMQALVKAKPEEGLWLQEVPVPAVGINDVLVRIHKTSNCGFALTVGNQKTYRTVFFAA